MYYKIGEADEDLSNVAWVLASPTESIQFSDGNSFREVEYDISGTQFYKYSIKIVLKSRNSSRVPTCRDLRVIALLP
jgi:hypothetical protein